MPFTPLTGYNRWTHGPLRESTVHAVAATYDDLRPTLSGDAPVTTVCGRTLQHVASIYGEDQWAPMWETSVRIGKTHVVNVCKRCVVKAVPPQDEIDAARAAHAAFAARLSQ